MFTGDPSSSQFRLPYSRHDMYGVPCTVFFMSGIKTGVVSHFKGGRSMNYEAVESKHSPDEWRVEAIDNEGRVFVTIFSGPAAKERANEYAAWKNGVQQSQLAHAASR